MPYPTPLNPVPNISTPASWTTLRTLNNPFDVETTILPGMPVANDPNNPGCILPLDQLTDLGSILENQVQAAALLMGIALSKFIPASLGPNLAVPLYQELDTQAFANFQVNAGTLAYGDWVQFAASGVVNAISLTNVELAANSSTAFGQVVSTGQAQGSNVTVAIQSRVTEWPFGINTVPTPVGILNLTVTDYIPYPMPDGTVKYFAVGTLA